MSKPVLAHETFAYGVDTVKACLWALFGTHIRLESPPGTFHADLPAHAVAELAAHPVNSLRLSAAGERWYPACEAQILIRMVSGDLTEVQISGTLAHAKGEIDEPFFERRIVEAALQTILHMLGRDLRRHAGKRSA